MLDPTLRAIRQLDDPALLGAVLRSVSLSAVAFLLLGAGGAWAFHTWVLTGEGGLWLGSLVGIALSVLAGFMLFVPITVVIASLFSDGVAEAVERRHYRWLLAATPAPLAVQVADGLVLGLRVLLYQLLAIALGFLVPGLGLIPGFLIAAWAMGRGLFLAVAMRRMSRAAATEAYRQRRWLVVGQGALVALAASVPVLNLLAPVIGVAALVHVLHMPARQG